MARMLERIRWLLLIGFLLSLSMLSFGYCYSPNATIPFSFKELSGTVYVTSPVENFNYSDSDVVVNVSLHIGGIEYEPNTHYVPYQNMSCIVSLDDAGWREMSLVSVGGLEAFSSVANPFWYSNTWLNYTAALHSVSGGQHYVRIGVKPDGIPLSYESSQGSLVYFNIINSAQEKPFPWLPVAAVSVIVGAVVAVAAVVYGKKRRR